MQPNGAEKSKVDKLIRITTFIILIGNFLYVLSSSFVLTNINAKAAEQKLEQARERAEFLEKIENRFFALEGKYQSREASLGRAALVDERLKHVETCCSQLQRHIGIDAAKPGSSCGPP